MNGYGILHVWESEYAATVADMEKISMLTSHLYNDLQLPRVFLSHDAGKKLKRVNGNLPWLKSGNSLLPYSTDPPSQDQCQWGVLSHEKRRERRKNHRQIIHPITVTGRLAILVEWDK